VLVGKFARFLEQIWLFDPRDDRDAGPIEAEQKAVARIVELRRAGRLGAKELREGRS
jgi:hypothetical protein